MFLGYSEKDESLLRRHNNLTVLDAVSSLDSFMREEVNNQVKYLAVSSPAIFLRLTRWTFSLFLSLSFSAPRSKFRAVSAQPEDPFRRDSAERQTKRILSRNGGFPSARELFTRKREKSRETGRETDREYKANTAGRNLIIRDSVG